MSETSGPFREAGPKSEILIGADDLSALLATKDASNWPSGWWVVPTVVVGIFLWVELISSLTI